jgi:hypothetical protein
VGARAARLAAVCVHEYRRQVNGHQEDVQSTVHDTERSQIDRQDGKANLGGIDRLGHGPA